MALEAHSIDLGNVVLEARLHWKETGTLGVIILHPYPLLGGFYNDPVVSTIYRLAKAAPEVSTVLRYNQRGVGGSGGVRSVWGARDCIDVAAICTYILGLQRPPQHLYIVGYSYGSCIAAHALSNPHVAGYVAVSPPLGGIAGIALRSGAHLSLLRAAPIPKLIIFGDLDQFGSVASAKAFVDRHNSACVPIREEGGAQLPRTLSGRFLSSEAQLKVFEDCDHFWLDNRQKVGELVVSWILETARLWALLGRDTPTDSGQAASSL